MMSSQNVNRVTVTGNLTADPTLRQTPSGTALTRMRIAVHERCKDPANGAWSERPNFFDVTVWGANAEACSRFLSIGSKVAVDGRLHWRQWTTDDGTKRQGIEIVAEHVEFLTASTSTGERLPVGATGATPDQDTPS